MKQFSILALLALTVLCSSWRGMEMPELHVQGRYLVDENGNRILLHGFGQTYSPWFNEQGSKWTNYDVDACLAYNKAKLDGVLDAGWKMNWLRLHMDPYWSNTPGEHTDGESDIHAFSMQRFKTFFNRVFLPMADYAEGNGLYVVMRPPGVCPETIAPGDAYQDYLCQVWKYVAQMVVKKKKTKIMFELANEPVNVNGSITQFFQAVVDTIRAQGCDNILWVPGRGYQSDYKSYVAEPIVGDNIGYAVHAYPGWYGSDSEQESAEHTGDVAGGGYEGFLAGWCDRVKPLANRSPILITEMDWAPKKYNASWGKSTTGTRGGRGFGANLKFMADMTGNVGWMLFTGAEWLEKYDPAAPDGSTFLTDPEACPRPIYKWFEDYAAEWPYERTDESRQLVALNRGCDYAIGLHTGDFTTLPIDAVYADGHTTCVTCTAQYAFGTKGLATYGNGIIRMNNPGTTTVTAALTDAFGTTRSVEARLSTQTNAIETIAADRGTGAIYNLAGQRIERPAKGVYIMNGKKYIK